MADPKIRVSEDVWKKARSVAVRMGLNSERAAIEAVFRVFADTYINAPPPSLTPTLEPPPHSEKSDCIAALDAVLSP